MDHLAFQEAVNEEVRIATMNEKIKSADRKINHKTMKIMLKS